jgi:glycosyltransferase involved in cell wall biosynthesis
MGRLFDVLSQVLAAVPGAAVLAVGASLFEGDGQTLGQKVAALGLEDRFVNTGWLEEQTLPHVLAAADAGLYLMDDTLLNRTKCPVKLADMLAVGLPVVAEAVGQVPEYVVQDGTGRLRTSGDVEGLAADLIELLQDERTRARLGAGGREHIVNHFSWEHLASIAEAAYQGD